MELFLFDTKKMLIGKLSKNMYRNFNINDKTIIEKNLNNLLNLKLVFSDYISNENKLIADTIAISKDGTLYLIGYKKSNNDDFYKRYTAQYNKIISDKNSFIENVKINARVKEVDIYNFKCIIFSSSYSKDEIREAKSFVIPCELYTWNLISNILVLDKV